MFDVAISSRKLTVFYRFWRLCRSAVKPRFKRASHYWYCSNVSTRFSSLISSAECLFLAWWARVKSTTRWARKPIWSSITYLRRWRTNLFVSSSNRLDQFSPVSLFFVTIWQQIVVKRCLCPSDTIFNFCCVQRKSSGTRTRTTHLVSASSIIAGRRTHK